MKKSKYIKVLSEEYIRLKECELRCLKEKANIAYVSSKNFDDIQDNILELESHILDLKSELEEPISIDGMTDWRDSQIN